MSEVCGRYRVTSMSSTSSVCRFWPRSKTKQSVPLWCSPGLLGSDSLMCVSLLLSLPGSDLKGRNPKQDVAHDTNRPPVPTKGWSRPCEAALYIGDERVPESPRRPQWTTERSEDGLKLRAPRRSPHQKTKRQVARGALIPEARPASVPRGTFSIPHTWLKCGAAARRRAQHRQAASAAKEKNKTGTINVTGGSAPAR
ncbi:hypothetical protein NDU88_005545 [Pleurodeles waltl]|uniref:Uncharacterized protein n=1 Tax=Pleurodeles waltl TaxID=8319 RepID=A0AAV7MD63_PLEWA|nr:hypothetical protein NDU88_005545 [Pleurodeles waltl]